MTRDELKEEWNRKLLTGLLTKKELKAEFKGYLIKHEMIRDRHVLDRLKASLER